jgi:plastocyanin
MRKLYVIVAVVAVSVAGVLALTGSAGAEGKRGGTTIKLLSETFSPDKKSISAGTKVKFKWIDGKHNIVKSSGPGGSIDSGIFNTPGVHFKHKFKKAGTYKLICTIHDNMKVKLNFK